MWMGKHTLGDEALPAFYLLIRTTGQVKYTESASSVERSSPPEFRYPLCRWYKTALYLNLKKNERAFLPNLKDWVSCPKINE